MPDAKNPKCKSNPGLCPQEDHIMVAKANQHTRCDILIGGTELDLSGQGRFTKKAALRKRGTAKGRGGGKAETQTKRAAPVKSLRE